MRLRQEPRISWRGVILVAIASAWIAVAVLLRGHAAQTGATHWVPTAGEWRLVLWVVALSLLLIAAAFLGSLFGYLRVAFRVRKLSKNNDSGGTPKV